MKTLTALGFYLALCSVAQARTWTSSAGSTMDAELLSHEGINVVLKTDGGRELTLTTSQLSQEDRDYLTSLQTASDKEEATTSKKTKKSKGRRGGRKLPDWENWEAEWPKLVKTSQDFEVTEGGDFDRFETHQYIYNSPHFTFYSDAKLTKSLVKKFSWYFESSLNYLSVLPLSLARTQEEERHVIVLYENKTDYHRNGGPEGSAGVYMGGEDIILVPFSSVGMKPSGSSYTVDRDVSNKTLSHEIVHSFTDWSYYEEGSRGWFTEGLAELVALTPYRSGIYQPGRLDSSVEEYVTAFDKDFGRGRNLGKDIKVGSLKEFMLMPYSEFTDKGGSSYGVAALLVTYFLDLEREEELGNVQSFLKAMKEGVEGEELLTVLLNGRTFLELEESIAKSWRGKGVKLTFSKR